MFLMTLGSTGWPDSRDLINSRVIYMCKSVRRRLVEGGRVEAGKGSSGRKLMTRGRRVLTYITFMIMVEIVIMGSEINNK